MGFLISLGLGVIGFVVGLYVVLIALAAFASVAVWVISLPFKLISRMCQPGEVKADPNVIERMTLKPLIEKPGLEDLPLLDDIFLRPEKYLPEGCPPRSENLHNMMVAAATEINRLVPVSA
jgi:hypothetical protein